MELAKPKDYFLVARVDHWVKQLFVLPGLVTGWVLCRPDVPPLSELVLPIILGLLATCLIASANYVLNDWLDAAYDRHHPLKAQRPFVLRQPNKLIILFEYGVLVAAGLGISLLINPWVFRIQVVLLISGWIYNLKPIRSKDIPFIDVLTESLNNPLRFLVGWFLVTESQIPPSSVLLAYWMGGAFLMGIKRYAEYQTVRTIQGDDALTAYRRVFRIYTGERLLVSSFFYALLSAFMMAVFLIKYRIEYLLLFPFISALFASYLRVALKPASRAQTPEKLIHEKALWFVVALLLVLFVFCSIVDIPQLHILIDPILGTLRS
ncbi:MAG: UbiA family prenyltransferase [Verrucomicrobia bacterium]|nr:UbiA family prenyltransferase [Verrucomicrobiota bacterium]